MKSLYFVSSLCLPLGRLYLFESYVLNVAGGGWKVLKMFTSCFSCPEKKNNINVDTAMDKWINGYLLVECWALFLEEGVKY